MPTIQRWRGAFVLCRSWRSPCLFSADHSRLVTAASTSRATCPSSASWVRPSRLHRQLRQAPSPCSAPDRRADDRGHGVVVVGVVHGADDRFLGSCAWRARIHSTLGTVSSRYAPECHASQASRVFQSMARGLGEHVLQVVGERALAVAESSTARRDRAGRCRPGAAWRGTSR